MKLEQVEFDLVSVTEDGEPALNCLHYTLTQQKEDR